MSQDTLGKEIGVTFQQIQKYERGVNRIGSSRLYDFSRILGIPVSYFFEEIQTDNDNLALGMAEDGEGFEAERLSDKETLALIRSYYKITDETLRKKVLNLIKAMAA